MYVMECVTCRVSVTQGVRLIVSYPGHQSGFVMQIAAQDCVDGCLCGLALLHDDVYWVIPRTRYLLF